MPSLLELPVSEASASVGAAGAAVSSVNAKAALLPLALPAASVWRAITDFAPSPASVKLAPLPVVQVVPPSVEYSQVAPASRPVTLT